MARPAPGHDAPQRGVQLLPPRVGYHPAGKPGQRVQLDPVRHRDGLAPAAAARKAAGVESAERQEPAGDRVETVELEDEPGVGPGFGQRLAQLRPGGDHS